MALKATIYKVNLSISDMDRHYYAEHPLTLALHPSETIERMMLRVIAFIFNASESLTFTKGLSDVDTPDLWQKNLHDDIELWIDLGQPPEQRVKKSCQQAEQVQIYSYQNSAFQQWWEKEQSQLTRRNNLKIVTIDEILAEQLTPLLQRSTNIQCSLSEGQAWLTIGDQTIEINPSNHYLP